MAKHLSSKTIFETPYFKINEIEIEFSSGLKKSFKIIDRDDTSMIVPINKKGEVILIREYFYAIDQRQISLPKGRIEHGLSDLETANKELQEEVGFKAQKLTKLGSLTITPGYLTQKTHIYLAQDLVESRLEGDEDEEIELLPTPLEKIDELIISGQITEARVIAALILQENF